MALHDPNIRENHPVIRPLDEAAINRIAAGEVVERPASAVKELVENALDAGARRVVVDYAGGGKTLIRVTDDGCGMAAGDLPLAVARHATSKIDGSDLLDIRSFGFRGEALASLGAVGRLKITSRAEGQDGAEISVDGRARGAGRGRRRRRGARWSNCRDLFFATPARLKFLRSDRAEAQAMAEVLRRLAMAEPLVGFQLNEVQEGAAPRVIFRADAEAGDFRGGVEGAAGAGIGAGLRRECALGRCWNATGCGCRAMRRCQPIHVGRRYRRMSSSTDGRCRTSCCRQRCGRPISTSLPRDRHPAAVLYVDLPTPSGST